MAYYSFRKCGIMFLGPSNWRLKAKSLMSYIARYKPAKALRLSMSRRGSSGVIEDYPLYAIHEMLDEV